MTSLSSLAGVLALDSPLRIAFLGRVSNEEAQDPSLSIPRQARKVAEFARDRGWVEAASYWDIESGRKELELRGNGADASKFGIAVRRDGGLPELIEAARRKEFDAVVVESIDRVSRSTADSTALERDLLRYDIPIFATDEPINLNATAVLNRRVKQAIAEWYVLDLLEKSRAGMEESTRQGWHTGGPIPYGYLGEEHEHPNPNKARLGLVKRRLIVDPICGPIVLLIFDWYVFDGLGLGEICDRLNKDLDRFPPPKRNKKDENRLRPCWSVATIQTILRNPKYTGFNVWNRHDKRPGKPFLKPREQWVWSSEPTHEPIVSREVFEMVEAQAATNENRSTAGKQAYAPNKRARGGRLYPTRGRCRCAMCNHRLEGTTQKGKPYMRCLWASGRGDAAVEATGHPKSLQVSERLLIDEALDVLANRVFAPDALERLHDELETDDGPTGAARTDADIEAIAAELAKIDTAIDRLVVKFEEYDDPDHPVVKATERRIEQQSAKRKTLQGELDALQRQALEQPSVDTVDIAALIGSVPDLRPALATYCDEELTALFEAFDLRWEYDHEAKSVAISLALVPELGERLEAIDYETTATGTPAGRRNPSIAGAGFEPATSGL
jgi:site-specific DNA recombinase